jgi:hypothetical protein
MAVMSSLAGFVLSFLFFFSFFWGPASMPFVLSWFVRLFVHFSVHILRFSFISNLLLFVACALTPTPFASIGPNMSPVVE